MIGKRGRPEPDARKALVMVGEPDGAAASAYRVALQSVLPGDHEAGGPRRTIVVAVDNGTDGAVATANLGVAAAAAGARTILIDANVHEPRLHALFGTPNDHGLSTLAGQASTSVIPTRVPGLALIPSGALSSDGTDVLARTAVAEAVRAVTTDSDLVLVSCPPLAEGPDAILVSRWVDTAIMIVSSRGTRRSDATRAKEQLERAGVRILGAMLYREGRA